MEEFLIVGHIIGTFSLDGTLKVISTTTFKNKRYKVGNTLTISDKKTNTSIDVSIKKYRVSQNIDLLTFFEIDNIDTAKKYIGADIKVKKTNDLLEEKEYYYCDLEQCFIYDNNNTLLGQVIKVEEIANKILLRVKSTNSEKEALIPYNEAFIKQVDIKNNKIIIEVIPGLL